MNMIEAFKKLKEAHDRREHIWIRPKVWKGAQCAYCLDRYDKVQTVPSSRGGFPSGMPDLTCMFAEWELVDPTDVNEGR